ncbi:zinc ABC transporter substrate-binding protein ZnuA [Neorhizobium galegae]|uniref:zinc ABC transporter substrate-binding protein ZnuA n=1 Tax=Neorhizobium galegae TaxID=399 RepID=UPI000620FCAE|nr:zinc ABC transporter substrate-binding protein ZnuA [Neorhizobium galegae]MCQ1778667.1 zinc ABC transporter substrate-binding protein ZnuA [Neorhizobium galegae]MCQ1795158.1 zinc ABC transporter substrate-binding protein ZnuA [Neorhizobium galegae]CDZ27356.1 High-affinity zinc uptake system protein ZnuA [Neorhizobium galegae bv. officinalis]
MKPASISLLSAAVFSIGAAPCFAAPDVVVSIKPIHSLVASIMKGVGEPKLIVDGAASPHTFSLKPSNAAAIEGADVIFWIGPGIEAFLEKPLDALAASATVIELEDAPGLKKLPFRESGAFEAHDHGDEAEEAHDHDHAAEDHAGHDDDHHDHGGFDTHLWLDPMNAKAMAAEIEKTLVSADPANAAAYQANGAALMKDIDALDAELKATIAPVRHKPFIVFHDAYQYFEHRYGVSVAGSITVSPETMPGAERVDQIQKKVKELGATCVFAEPQFEPKLVAVVTEGTPARSGTLDPEAATLKSGSSLYFELMRGLARSMKECLSQGT